MPTSSSKKTRGNKKRSSKRAPSAKAAEAAGETASAESTPATSAPAEATGVAFGDKAKFIRRFPRNAKAKWLMAEYLKETGQTMSENHVYNIHKEMKAEERAAKKTTSAKKKTGRTAKVAAKKVAAAERKTGAAAGRNLTVVRGNGAKRSKDDKQKYYDQLHSAVLALGMVDSEAFFESMKAGRSGVKIA